MLGIDVSEERLVDESPGVLEELLRDRTVGSNIIWATDHYAHLGPAYSPEREITVPLITGAGARAIQPRVSKTRAQQWDRTKVRAEVFTPSWLCNEQNSRIDDVWFGRTDVFNTVMTRSWVEQTERIRFSPAGDRTWQRYVEERRLEVACGEAPYLVSRYDATTGEALPLKRRVGLLDRKLRVVTENAVDADEWVFWARRAFESTYAFEYQGDSLLLARENLLATYTDYAIDALRVQPTPKALLEIATIVSWNIWQMNAHTGLPPLARSTGHSEQLDIFGDWEDSTTKPCVIRDWSTGEVHQYQALTKRTSAR